MSEVAAFVPAGGKSTRMGVDKAFLELGGRTLLTRALEALRLVASEVWIVGAAAKFAAFGPVVEDIFPDCGPLGAIHAALRSSVKDINVFLAVDMPFVPAEFLKYLVAEAKKAPTAIATVPRTGGRWQPLCAVYRTDFAALAETALLRGRNKIDTIFDLPQMRLIEDDELMRAGFLPAIFQNLNTRQQLEAARDSRIAAE